MSIMRRLCTFDLAGLLFGVNALQVQEIIKAQQLTHVPLAPSVITGLVNLRGQIVTAVDLRVRLGLEPRPPEVTPMNVVMQTSDGLYSLVVDRIGDVLFVEDGTFEAPPPTLPHTVQGLITGVHKLKDRLLLVLDAERTLQLA